MAEGVPASAFSELLARHRAGAGLSQRDLSARSGLSERALRDLERGVRMPRPQSARLVADALKLTGHDLTAFLAAARADVPAAEPAAPLGDLVGRADDLRVLLDLVLEARHRLVTVTGQAGIGKSRLVAELAELLAGRTDLAVRTLDLSAVHEVNLVGEMAANALGTGQSRLDPVERVAAHLRDRRVVLVVDRFEQVVAAGTELAMMVRRCPGLTVVVTSQRRLQVRDERTVVLCPLEPAAAAALFARRAEAVHPDFVLDADTGPTVAAICQRVGHLPLAIELAAARVRHMHLVELAGRLDRQLQILTGGDRDLPDRHRSLRAAIESSLAVADAGARTVFRWLGAFSGGGRLADIEAVATALGHDPDWLLAALTELIDINLVRVTPEDDAFRYSLLDMMAELAAEQLQTDSVPIRRAVAAHYLNRVSRGSAGSEPAVVDQDAANVRSAAGWAAAHEPSLLTDGVFVGLGRFYETTGRLIEGEDILSRVAATGLPAAWIRAGQLAALRGDLDTATDFGTRGLAAADPAGRVAALNLLAQAAVERGDPGAGGRHLREALGHARRAGDDALLGRVLNNLSSVSMELGRPQDASRQMTAALAAKRRSGAGPVELGRTLFNLADIALDMGENAAVISRAAEGVPLLVTGGFPRLAALAEATCALGTLYRDGPTPAMAVVSRALRLLGDAEGDDRRTEAVIRMRCSVIQHASGDTDAAAQALTNAVATAMEYTSRDRDQVADALQRHASYVVQHDPRSAAAMLGAGEHIRRRRIPASVKAIRDHASVVAQQKLGDAAYDEEFRAGVGLDRAGLVALCRKVS